MLISCSWCEWYAVVGSDSVGIVPGGGSQYLYLVYGKIHGTKIDMLRKIRILNPALVFETILKLCLCKEMQRNFFFLI